MGAVSPIETEAQELVKPNISEGNDLLAFAEAYRVTDQESADLFGHWRVGLRDRIKAVIDKLAPAKKKTYDAWKEICKLETEAVKPLEDAQRCADRKIVAFHNEQVRRAEIWRQAESAEAHRLEEEHRLAVAAEQEAAGEHEAAEATISEPIAPIAVAPAPKPAVQGLTFRETYKAEVTDKAAFLKAVGSNKALLHLADPNMTALNQLARAQKEMLDIPGLKVTKEKQPATGRR
jgi:hypothetical protein